MKNKCDHDGAHSHSMLDASSCSAIVDDGTTMLDDDDDDMQWKWRRNDMGSAVWVVCHYKCDAHYTHFLFALHMRSSNRLIPHEKKNALHVWSVDCVECPASLLVLYWPALALLDRTPNRRAKWIDKKTMAAMTTAPIHVRTPLTK